MAPSESVLQPKWAPDGSLLYGSDRSDWWNLYRWRAASAGSVEVAPMEAEVGGPQWVFGLSDYDIDDDGTVYAFAHGPQGARLLALSRANRLGRSTSPRTASRTCASPTGR